MMIEISNAKVQWRCRRGLLELDLLLFPFYKSEFEQLSSSLKQLFIELLDCPDPAIYNWFLGIETPPSLFSPIIERLREYHKQIATRT